MGTRTFWIDDSPDALLDENTTNLTLVRADPLASTLVPAFEGLMVDWTEVNALRVEHRVAVSTAVARTVYIDRQLNNIADELVLLLDKITKKDRSDPRWSVFFGHKDLWYFKRPRLGSKLEAMKRWPGALAAMPHDELKALAAKLTPLLVQATAAEEDVRVKKQALVEFKNVGRWRQHVDKGNAVRKAAYGYLSELPHKYPELKLPRDYADQFFGHDTSRRGAGELPSEEEIDAKLAAAEQDVVELKAEKEAVLAKKKKESEAEAERQKQLAALAAAEQKEKAAKAEAEALRRELGKKGGKK